MSKTPAASKARPPVPDPSQSLPVCIVGAGSSGVAMAKALKEKGIAFECFELGSDIGGMWRYENDNGLSSAYRSLHIDTSRRNLGYSDFPIADHYPDFLSHAEVLEHLEAYAAKFDVRPHIRFNSRVVDVRPDPARGGWLVRLQDGSSGRYRAVLVANGHLWDPRWPTFPGRFDGTVIHSHDYRTAEPFRDKDVLIVGIGNSAVDIAVDVCRQARSTTLSTRRSAWIMPKYIMGVPVDRWSAFMTRKLRFPTRLTRALMRRLMFLAVGDQARFGVPRPRHAIWREHATLSQELLSHVGHGWIRIRPDIRELCPAEVVFVDDSRRTVDAIIFATGYRTTFPFIDPSLFEVSDAKVELYRRMVAPSLPGLYLIGLVQPVGPTIPLVEIQAKWVASVLAGETRLPDEPAMRREIRRHAAGVARRYVGSARYTLEVDFGVYARQLRRDVTRGLAGTR
jgi:dimethylaniline monooxygenase (N-oxide forming)